MPQARERGAARARPRPSGRKPMTRSRAAVAADVATAAGVTKAMSRNNARPQTGPDAKLMTLLARLRKQNDVIAAIEKEREHLSPGITDASRAQERRLVRALGRRAAILDSVIALNASAPAGLRVKAEALWLAALEQARVPGFDPAEGLAGYVGLWDRLAVSLARDILAWTSAI